MMVKLSKFFVIFITLFTGKALRIVHESDIGVPDKHLYIPSEFERIANPTADWGCHEAMQEKTKVWLSSIAERSIQDPTIFSQLRIPGEPTVYLEPLAFELKDPRVTCPVFEPGFKHQFEKDTNGMEFLSKAYLALPPNWSYVGNAKIKYFDLGAGWYDGNPPNDQDWKTRLNGWGESGKWFVEEYEKRGMPIDHMYLWEANVAENEYRQAGLPNHYKEKITFHQGLIQADGAEDLNPLNVLKRECAIEDYCILKMDFDTTETELALYQKLINDDGIRILVDEFYWDPVGYDTKEMYNRLLKLRELGVRAHAWV